MSMQDYKNQILVQYAHMQPTDHDYILIKNGNKLHWARNGEMQ